MWTGSRPLKAIRDSRVSRISARWSKSLIARNILTAARSIRGFISPPRFLISSVFPTASVATGALKACIGCLMSCSKTIYRAIAAATALKTWPSSAVSPLALFAPTRLAAASKPKENQPAGILAFFLKYFNSTPVNPESVPWVMSPERPLPRFCRVNGQGPKMAIMRFCRKGTISFSSQGFLRSHKTLRGDGCTNGR